MQPVESQRLILVSEAMSFIKPIFWDSKVKWSLASLKAQPGPGSSLSFSLVAPATFSTSSLTSWSSFRFPGARVWPQVSQAHTGQGCSRSRAWGSLALHWASHDPRAQQAARAQGSHSLPYSFFILFLLCTLTLICR